MLPFDEGYFAVARRRRLDGELVVGPSLVMSSFCYSIFRLDPYLGCGHSCAYCYTRFLPGLRPARPVARLDYPRLLRSTAKELGKTGVRLPPLRMSALTDPFQPLERGLRLSLRLLEVAREFEIPLIISTKSSLVAEEPWLDAVKELAGEGLAVVQLSIAFLDDRVARVLEPGAPPPSERLKTAEKLSGEGVPIVLRLQPIVPLLNSEAEFLEEYADAARAVGAKHLIAEVLRIASWRDLEPFRRVMSGEEFKALSSETLWERFPLGSHKHPRADWRRQVYAQAGEAAARKGISFALCREGFYDLMRAPDCCGIYLLKSRILRPTLYELLYGEKPGYEYLRPEDIEKIPLPELRKKLREHYEVLRRVTSNSALLKKLAQGKPLVS
jgi:DNA repair photolyase